MKYTMLAVARQYAKCSKSINPVNPLHKPKGMDHYGSHFMKDIKTEK